MRMESLNSVRCRLENRACCQRQTSSVVERMAQGVRAALRSDWAIATTGIAGPDGGTPDKPVGTVCFGWARPGEAARTATCRFAGDREAIRRQAVIHALEALLQYDA